MAFILTSPTFSTGEYIPSKHTCEGENVSPELEWDHVPEETLSLVLIVHDPDAPDADVTHWVLYDILPDREGIEEDALASEVGTPGANDFGELRYQGPCPPRGRHPHHYHFVLYALDKETLGLERGARRVDVEEMIKGSVVSETELVGLYRRM